MKGKVSKRLAIYLLKIQGELLRIRYDISNRQDMRYDYELRDLTNMEKRTAMIKRILHVVTLQKESDPFRAFVEQPTPQHRSTCLQRLDELIAYCSQFSPLYMKDANRASMAHLENELVVHGWNTWQRHPPSDIMYNTPEFTLEHVKDAEEERRYKCGCYLCTYVPTYTVGAQIYFNAD